MRRNLLQGGRADFPILGVSPEDVGKGELDKNELARTGITGLAQRLSEYPDYQAVFWLATPQGRGRYSVHVDLKGNVQPHLLHKRFGLGTEGVKESETHPGELDCERFLHNMLAKGWVRVDHLENAEGEKLGIPPSHIWRERTTARDWCWELFDAARLQQLQRELREYGRELLPTFNPQIPRHVLNQLEDAEGKSAGQIARDNAIRNAAQRYLGKLRERYMAALYPDEKASTPATDVGVVAAILAAYQQGQQVKAEAASALDEVLNINEVKDLCRERDLSLSEGGKALNKATLISSILDHAKASE